MMKEILRGMRPLLIMRLSQYSTRRRTCATATFSRLFGDERPPAGNPKFQSLNPNNLKFQMPWSGNTTPYCTQGSLTLPI